MPRRTSRSKSNVDTVVLIVDDEPVVRNMVRSIIQAEGYSFLVAGNGQDALTLSRAYPGDIHILLTDFAMPQMNGGELANKIIAERPDIRVLVISGRTSDEVRKATRFFGKS
jgi:CheY-like chemotaxis protein